MRIHNAMVRFLPATPANAESLAKSRVSEDMQQWEHFNTAVGSGDQWATLGESSMIQNI